MSKGNCELCEREKELTFHHLIPQINHSKNAFQRLFSKEDMKTRGLMLCRECHSMIHRTLDNKTLGLEYNTKELLLGHEGIFKFIEWVKKQNKKVKK